MIRTRRDLALASCSDDVAGTVLISAEKRSAALNFLRLIWFGRIKRGIGSLRIACRPTGDRQLLVIVRAVPVSCPLPHVPSHVVKSVSIGWVLRHRCNADKSIFASVVYWKVSLVSVRHPLVMRTKLIAPHKRLSRRPSTCGKFPLCLSWQSLSSPFCESLSVGVCDVHDWIVILAPDVAVRT